MGALFFATPTYDGTRRNAMSITQVHLAFQGKMLVAQHDEPSSLLAANVNESWCKMLNLRKKLGISHFLLLHADVEPTDMLWAPQMIEEMAAVGADVLSVVIPLKDETGLTSTAQDTHRWAPRRYTMREVYQQPETWTEDNLLVNTGCMLVDVRNDWVEDVCFTINDAILKVGDRFVKVVEGEDWNFSRQCQSLMRTVFATRKIALNHWDGRTAYANTKPWGTFKIDEVNARSCLV